jgi:hypothetical protein
MPVISRSGNSKRIQTNGHQNEVGNLNKNEEGFRLTETPHRLFFKDEVQIGVSLFCRRLFLCPLCLYALLSMQLLSPAGPA